MSTASQWRHTWPAGSMDAPTQYKPGAAVPTPLAVPFGHQLASWSKSQACNFSPTPSLALGMIQYLQHRTPTCDNYGVILLAI